MRIAAIVLVALLLALAAALLIPVLSQPGSPALEGEATLLAMIEAAPDGAEHVVAIPTFAPTWRRFAPLIEPMIKSRADRRSLAAASWLVGRGPVVIWTSEGGWGASARPDALHRFLIRAASPFVSTPISVEEEGARFGQEASPAVRPLDPRLAEGLAGHLFVLHGEKGSYPPMPRPALTAVRFGEGALQIATRGRRDPGAIESVRLGNRTLPGNALLAARFAEPPRAVLAMENIAPIRFERFLREGAMVALYGVEDGGLVPRPLIAFSVPADEARYEQMVAAVDRAMAKGAVGLLLGPQPERVRTIAGVEITHREGLGLTLEYALRNGELLFAFDDRSLEELLRGRPVAAGNGRASWGLRASPRDLLPVLDELGSSRGLRLLARGLSNTSRELARALRALPPTEELAAELREEGEFVTLTAEARLEE